MKATTNITGGEKLTMTFKELVFSRRWWLDYSDILKLSTANFLLSLKPSFRNSLIMKWKSDSYLKKCVFYGHKRELPFPIFIEFQVLKSCDILATSDWMSVSSFHMKSLYGWVFKKKSALIRVGTTWVSNSKHSLSDCLLYHLSEFTNPPIITRRI